MKNNLTQYIKILGIALIIGLGVSAVSAFTNPGSTSPGVNVPDPVNTGIENQTKNGGILSEKYFLSELSFFTKMLLPGSDSWVNIGGPLNVAPTGINNGGSTIPLTIDLTNRATVSKNGTQGQNAANFITGESSCPTATTFINDHAPAFEFTSASNNTGHADLIARQIKLVGGSPQDNSVLAAVDSQGNAVWAHLVVQNGVLKVINNQTGSPVVTDASCGVPQTYTWSTGAWGQCVPYMTNDWVDFYPSSSPAWGTMGQSCTSWINTNSSGYNGGIQTRDVTCTDSNGNTVPDNLCTTPKPDTTKPCTIPLQVRVKVTIQGTLGQTVNYTDPGYCLYDKLQNPNSTDPLGNLFPLDCQVRPTTQSVPSGYNPASSCFLLNFSGGPGYGFNAGNPGGWTATGSATWQLQIKPQ